MDATPLHALRIRGVLILPDIVDFKEVPLSLTNQTRLRRVVQLLLAPLRELAVGEWRYKAWTRKKKKAKPSGKAEEDTEGKETVPENLLRLVPWGQYSSRRPYDIGYKLGAERVELFWSSLGLPDESFASSNGESIQVIWVMPQERDMLQRSQKAFDGLEVELDPEATRCPPVEILLLNKPKSAKRKAKPNFQRQRWAQCRKKKRRK